ncbi:MAG: ribonuclease, partial [Thermoleophilaceae bacterium]|nr:ribonuclease [Thermoleophilaceae bacterium]
LAAALAHTPEAEEVLRGARTRMARKPSALARDLLRNFPKGRRRRGGRRRKRGGEGEGGEGAPQQGQGQQRSQQSRRRKKNANRDPGAPVEANGTGNSSNKGGADRGDTPADEPAAA